MELLLIRHALPERRENADGPADPELSAQGRAQAEHMAKYLATETVHAVYTSPLHRARQTAAPLCELFGLDATVVDDLAEFDRDANEYIPMEELKATGDPRFFDVLANADGVDPDEFSARVVAAVERIVADHQGGSVAVVCHGGVINTYLAHVLGIPFEPPGFFYPNYTSIHRVAGSRSGVRSLVTLNETSFLRGTGLPMGIVQQG